MGWMGKDRAMMIGTEYEEVEFLYREKNRVLWHKKTKAEKEYTDAIAANTHWLVLQDKATDEKWLVLVRTILDEKHLYYQTDGEENNPAERVPESLKRVLNWPTRNAAAKKWREENGITGHEKKNNKQIELEY